jgi:hypothetical protein
MNATNAPVNGSIASTDFSQPLRLSLMGMFNTFRNVKKKTPWALNFRLAAHLYYLTPV